MNLVASILLIGGFFFVFAGVIGILRLPDFYTRAHSPAKAATLGLLLVALGSGVIYPGRDAAFWLERILLIVFVLISVPIGTQMLVRGATARGLPQSEGTQSAPISGRTERLEEAER